MWRPASQRVARAAGLAAQQQARSYSLLDKLSKKAKEAVDKSKSAADEALKSAGGDTATRLQQLKEQAAAASSTLGEKMQQAQELAKATAEELKKQGMAGGPAGGSGASEQQAAAAGGEAGPEAAAAGQQQQEQQEQQQGGDAGEGAKQQLGGKPGVQGRFKGFAAAAVEEIVKVMKSEEPTSSALRGSVAKAGNVQTASTDALAVTKQQQSAWQRQYEDMREKLGSHPFFARMRGLNLGANPVISKGREAAESIRERWETSDSPLVHRIQDAMDSLQSESEQAKALREIRSRDPAFDMVTFLRNLKQDVRTLIKAYLESDEELIKEHCSPEMIERLTGIMRVQKQQGLVPDPTILDTSEVELVDVKFLEEEPIVVVQFTCQQINCTRDTFGNVVDGKPDEVHRVYYFWALQQEKQGFVGADGAYHPPRWQLREMLIRGMHHLL
ncbi:Mitochondrial import inner membrane translocase subunit TIM44 [Chlorella sorokiniana]|uniref:Mitochondrial import inner membrane translocase subunit TIM44 n=1 Tax=Chlorella sorokiniana TaxID=3076 RepID=A0A2P6U1W9_CHLSO|nr:Mitochondrial import inner membrane translocase subunit TIM44 [Chlorella sorokiniana]|eukprot:PRW60304.1 Mitochondrial import inner membrane translocase subunit TIM44 [Chlorella sorokiniana]